MTVVPALPGRGEDWEPWAVAVDDKVRNATLPDGIVIPDGFTATPGQVLADAESLTGWAAVDATLSPALDATEKTTGTTSVRVNLETAAATAAFHVTLASAQPRGVFTQLLFDLRFVSVDGSGMNPGTMTRFKVTDGAALTGTAVVVDSPTLPPETWATIAIDVSALTSVRSVGLQLDQAGAVHEVGGQKHGYWIDNVRFAGVTELDAALDSGDVRTALIGPGYASDVPQEAREISATKTVVDTRPGKQLFTRHGGVRHIREFGVDETGQTDVSVGINAALSSLLPGERLEFTPQGFYWADKPLVMRDLRNVTVDFRGASLFTRAFRGGDNNVEDAQISIEGCVDTTLRDVHIYGWRERPSTGLQLLDAAGSPVASGSTKQLAAQGDAVRSRFTANSVSAFYARYPLAQFPTAQRALIAAYDPHFQVGNAFFVTLSDSGQVAGDCVLEIFDGFDDTTLLASRTLTLTSTPTQYVLTWVPDELRRGLLFRVRKATATANTITVASMTEYGYTDYSSSHDSANTIDVGDSQRILIEDLHVEGSATDALDATDDKNDGVTVRRLLSRCCNRQGIGFNRGKNYLLEDFLIIGAGRSGVDVEPYAHDWLVSGMTIRNGEISGVLNYAFALANWAGIENMVIDDVVVDGCGTAGVLIGGSRGGSISRILGNRKGRFYGGVGSDHAFQINGIGMLVSDITADGSVVVGSNGGTWGPTLATAKFWSPDNNSVQAAITGNSGEGVLGLAGRNNRIEITRLDLPSAPGALFGRDNQRGFGGAFRGETGFTRSFPISHGYEIARHVPVVPGGFDLHGQAVLGVAALASARATRTAVKTSAAHSAGGGSSSAVDLGARGATGPLRLLVSDVTGTLPTLDVMLQLSQNGTDWYDAGGFPTVTGPTAQVIPLRNLERYIRLAWAVAGPGAQFTFSATLDHALPGVNLSGRAQAVMQGASAGTVTFPTDVNAPSILSATPVGVGSAGSLTPSATYYYRIGAQGVRRGPKAWAAEKSVVLSGAQTAVGLDIVGWHNGWSSAIGTSGMSILRGTSPGVYTARFDVLPKAFALDHAGRHDNSFWVDLGASITPSGEFTGFPQTYLTPAGPFLPVDESGWEPDAAYAVQVTPSWLTTVAVTARRRDGFDVAFGTVAPAGATFDWFLVR